MKKDQKSILVLLAIFVVLLSTTLVVSFSSNLDVQEVIVKSITPVYDSNSTIEVDNNNVVFNDKNQVVEYKVIIENTQNYDVKITDIKLTTPTEEFLEYTVEDISKDDILVANSTKELTISLETMGIKGWGRNFADELAAEISFEKVASKPPIKHPSSNDKNDNNDRDDTNVGTNSENVSSSDKNEQNHKLEPPASTITEVIKNSRELEVTKVTNDLIVFKKDIKLEVGDKIAVWIYSEPIFLGYFDIVEINGVKQIIGLEEVLKNVDIEIGDHNIVLSTKEGKTLGYVEVYVGKNNTLSKENPEEGKVENPYTSDKGLLVVLVIATGVTGSGIILVSKNKFAKYTVFIILLSSTLSITNAGEPIETLIKFDVSFESQNVMKVTEYRGVFLTDHWQYNKNIRNMYIQNEVSEIKDYTYHFDVSEAQNGRVNAYLIKVGTWFESPVPGVNLERDLYDLYLQADGIIYLNSNASYYFADMHNLDTIDNMAGIDTSNVTNMSYMFMNAGHNNDNFTLDLSSFDTSNVTDMQMMFYNTGYNSETLMIDITNFDTSNVTNMNSMFDSTGYNSENFTLDVSGFDTSNVIDMSWMFNNAGYNSTKLNTSITISNPNTTSYEEIFYNVATKEGSQIKVNYTSKTEELVAKMIATKYENSNVVKGNCIDCGEGYIPIGTEISIGEEKFNVISQTDDTITMLTKYNLGTDYRQSSVQNSVKFADTKGWEYTPGPKEIDIQTWSTNPKLYVNEYVEYLKEELGDDTVTGDLITLKDLEELGCTVPSDYDWGAGEWECYNSPYGWIANDQWWWTRSAVSTQGMIVWDVDYSGTINTSYYLGSSGVRPVIIISKETLKNLE